MFKWIIPASLMAILLAAPAHAAPFCVDVSGISPQCDYVDAVQCRRRAQELAGVCIANASELTLRPGIGKFCMVDSSHNALCDYADRESCTLDASRNNGVCIDNTNATVQQDPYQTNPNRQY